MPKQKTRKSIARRFKITPKGKVLRRQSFRRHLKAGKSKSRLKNLKRVVEIKGFYAKKIKKALGF
ncbi:MAG: hypothetical protein ACD_57C00015G0002 [uncultured bacterium]|uniref:Large ribosomal subunit protein bL35 n=1 Tax=Candidatus Woesebacteria bacterium RIFCSPLOWO2_01_FULL_39_21 TaxID=1802519 RepID=A0A1F8BK83_9BACT|nr:MAG: hypothetical protein ACD_57C00015G0002 [uncultured bacterium]OGM23325.1 MAG: 50S ribosomal protein L35 [Candidatus Woesebacteria bacterium RIFCSPHIGHO2_01_FULL_39_23]OGM64477.1 MAG: 50S ribosomal protein L35 [Candidatus Woesebacteria bacterium RIFCSPLOWO2_01_FULL_39_21]